MKKLITIIIACIATVSTSVHAQMLTKITCESIPNTNGTTVASTSGAAGPFNAEVNNLSNSGTVQLTGKHATTTTAYSTPSGNGSAKAFSSNNWKVNDYYQFTLSNTTGFSGLTVSFASYSSSTGPGSFNFQYSLNGTTFITFSAYAAGADGFTPTTTVTDDTQTFNLSAITGLNNSSTPIYFRMTDSSTTSAAGGTVAATGTSRFDDFTVTTVTTVPEPTTWTVIVSGGAALLMLQRLRKGNRM